jgi:hypothetical protein
VFSHQRPIEKVIDYSHDDEQRLLTAINEYKVTDNVQGGIQLFLDSYGKGVRGTSINEIAIWVSSFYGSGKSSFTNYLGFAGP